MRAPTWAAASRCSVGTVQEGAQQVGVPGLHLRGPGLLRRRRLAFRHGIADDEVVVHRRGEGAVQDRVDVAHGARPEAVSAPPAARGAVRGSRSTTMLPTAGCCAPGDHAAAGSPTAPAGTGGTSARVVSDALPGC